VKDAAIFLAVALILAFLLTGDPPVGKLLHLVVVKVLKEKLNEADSQMVPYP